MILPVSANALLSCSPFAFKMFHTLRLVLLRFGSVQVSDIFCWTEPEPGQEILQPLWTPNRTSTEPWFRSKMVQVKGRTGFDPLTRTQLRPTLCTQLFNEIYILFVEICTCSWLHFLYTISRMSSESTTASGPNWIELRETSGLVACLCSLKKCCLRISRPEKESVDNLLCCFVSIRAALENSHSHGTEEPCIVR